MDFGTIFVEFKSNVDSFTRELRQVGFQLSVMEALARTQEQVWRAVAVTAFYASRKMLSGMLDVANAAGQVDQSMQYLKTSLVATDKEFAQIRDTAMDWSSNHVTSMNELVKASYDMASAGLNVSQVMATMENASTLAVGALGTMAQATSLLVTSFNVFAKTMPVYMSDLQKAEQMTNVFAGTAQKFKIILPEIESGMSRVAGVSAAYGVDIADAATALGALTSAGLTAEQAGTAIKGFYDRLAKASSVLGINVYDSTGKIKGLFDILGEVKGAFGGAVDGTTDLAKAYSIFTVRGSQLITLLQGNSEALKEVAAASKDSSVALDMAAKVEQGFNAQMQILANQATNLKIVLGDALIGTIKGLASLIGDLATGFRALPEPIAAAIVNIGLFGSIGTIITTGIAMVAPAVTGLIKNFGSMSDAVKKTKIFIEGTWDMWKKLGNWILAATTQSWGFLTSITQMKAALAAVTTWLFGAQIGFKSLTGTILVTTKALLGFLLNPWVLAITAIVVGIGFLIKGIIDTGKAAEEAKEAMKALNEQTSSFISTVVAFKAVEDATDLAAGATAEYAAALKNLKESMPQNLQNTLINVDNLDEGIEKTKKIEAYYNVLKIKPLELKVTGLKEIDADLQTLSETLKTGEVSARFMGNSLQQSLQQFGISAKSSTGTWKTLSQLLAELQPIIVANAKKIADLNAELEGAKSIDFSNLTAAQQEYKLLAAAIEVATAQAIEHQKNQRKGQQKSEIVDLAALKKNLSEAERLTKSFSTLSGLNIPVSFSVSALKTLKALGIEITNIDGSMKSYIELVTELEIKMYELGFAVNSTEKRIAQLGKQIDNLTPENLVAAAELYSKAMTTEKKMSESSIAAANKKKQALQDLLEQAKLFDDETNLGGEAIEYLNQAMGELDVQILKLEESYATLIAKLQEFKEQIDAIGEVELAIKISGEKIILDQIDKIKVAIANINDNPIEYLHDKPELDSLNSELVQSTTLLQNFYDMQGQNSLERLNGQLTEARKIVEELFEQMTTEVVSAGAIDPNTLVEYNKAVEFVDQLKLAQIELESLGYTAEQAAKKLKLISDINIEIKVIQEDGLIDNINKIKQAISDIIVDTSKTDIEIGIETNKLQSELAAAEAALNNFYNSISGESIEALENYVKDLESAYTSLKTNLMENFAINATLNPDLIKQLAELSLKIIEAKTNLELGKLELQAFGITAKKAAEEIAAISEVNIAFNYVDERKLLDSIALIRAKISDLYIQLQDPDIGFGAAYSILTQIAGLNKELQVASKELADFYTVAREAKLEGLENNIALIKKNIEELRVIAGKELLLGGVINPERIKQYSDLADALKVAQTALSNFYAESRAELAKSLMEGNLEVPALNIDAAKLSFDELQQYANDAYEVIKNYATIDLKVNIEKLKFNTFGNEIEFSAAQADILESSLNDIIESIETAKTLLPEIPKELALAYTEAVRLFNLAKINDILVNMKKNINDITGALNSAVSKANEFIAALEGANTTDATYEKSKAALLEYSAALDSLTTQREAFIKSQSIDASGQPTSGTPGYQNNDAKVIAEQARLNKATLMEYNNEIKNVTKSIREMEKQTAAAYQAIQKEIEAARKATIMYNNSTQGMLENTYGEISDFGKAMQSMKVNNELGIELAKIGAIAKQNGETEIETANKTVAAYQTALNAVTEYQAGLALIGQSSIAADKDISNFALKLKEQTAAANIASKAAAESAAAVAKWEAAMAQIQAAIESTPKIEDFGDFSSKMFNVSELETANSKLSAIRSTIESLYKQLQETPEASRMLDSKISELKAQYDKLRETIASMEINEIVSTSVEKKQIQTEVSVVLNQSDMSAIETEISRVETALTDLVEKKYEIKNLGISDEAQQRLSEQVNAQIAELKAQYDKLRETIASMEINEIVSTSVEKRQIQTEVSVVLNQSDMSAIETEISIVETALTDLVEKKYEIKNLMLSDEAQQRLSDQVNAQIADVKSKLDELRNTKFQIQIETTFDDVKSELDTLQKYAGALGENIPEGKLRIYNTQLRELIALEKEAIANSKFGIVIDTSAAKAAIQSVIDQLKAVKQEMVDALGGLEALKSADAIADIDYAAGVKAAAVASTDPSLGTGSMDDLSAKTQVLTSEFNTLLTARREALNDGLDTGKLDSALSKTAGNIKAVENAYAAAEISAEALAEAQEELEKQAEAIRAAQDSAKEAVEGYGTKIEAAQEYNQLSGGSAEDLASAKVGVADAALKQLLDAKAELVALGDDTSALKLNEDIANASAELKKLKKELEEVKDINVYNQSLETFSTEVFKTSEVAKGLKKGFLSTALSIGDAFSSQLGSIVNFKAELMASGKPLRDIDVQIKKVESSLTGMANELLAVDFSKLTEDGVRKEGSAQTYYETAKAVNGINKELEASGRISKELGDTEEESAEKRRQALQSSLESLVAYKTELILTGEASAAEMEVLNKQIAANKEELAKIDAKLAEEQAKTAAKLAEELAKIDAKLALDSLVTAFDDAMKEIESIREKAFKREFSIDSFLGKPEQFSARADKIASAMGELYTKLDELNAETKEYANSADKTTAGMMLMDKEARATKSAIEELGRALKAMLEQRFKDSLTELANSFAIISEELKAFGDEADAQGAQLSAYKQAIKELIALKVEALASNGAIQWTAESEQALQDLIDKYKALEKAIEDAAKKQADIDKQTGAVADAVKSAYSDFAEAIKSGESLQTAMKGLKKNIKNNIKQAILDGLIESLIASAAMKEKFEAIGEYLSDALADGVISSSEQSGLNGMIEGLANDAEQIGNAVATAIGGLNFEGDSNSLFKLDTLTSSLSSAFNEFATNLETMSFDKAWKKTGESLRLEIKRSIVQAMIAGIMESAALKEKMTALGEMIGKALNDGIITATEQSEIDLLTNNLMTEAEKQAEIIEEMMKSLGLSKGSKKSTTTQNATSNSGSTTAPELIGGTTKLGDTTKLAEQTAVVDKAKLATSQFTDDLDVASRSINEFGAAVDRMSMDYIPEAVPNNYIPQEPFVPGNWADDLPSWVTPPNPENELPDVPVVFSDDLASALWGAVPPEFKSALEAVQKEVKASITTAGAAGGGKSGGEPIPIGDPETMLPGIFIDRFRMPGWKPPSNEGVVADSGTQLLETTMTQLEQAMAENNLLLKRQLGVPIAASIGSRGVPAADVQPAPSFNITIDPGAIIVNSQNVDSEVIANDVMIKLKTAAEWKIRALGGRLQ